MINHNCITTLIFISSLVLGFGLQNMAYADNVSQTSNLASLQNSIPPFNVPYSSNPVIITQVELATPLEQGYEPTTNCDTYQNGTKICHTLESPYRTNPNSPYYNVKCGFYGYSTCELLHQFYALNSTCDIPDNNSQANQWVEIYNSLNSTVQLTDFGVTRILDSVQSVPSGSPPEYAGAYHKGDWTLTLSSHQSCFIGFLGNTGSDLEFPLNDTSLAVTYTYANKYYMAATPFLNDLSNDTRTWQFDGTSWTYSGKQSAIPEFPFAIPVLLTIAMSLIFYHTYRNRQSLKYPLI